MANKLVIAAIVAFVAVDIVLAVAAVQHVRTTPPTDKDAISIPTSAASSTAGQLQPSGSPSSQPPETVTPSQTSQSQQPSEPTSSLGLLSIGNDGTILRATPGNCRSDQTGEVEVSTDGGVSFRTVFAGVRQVLRVVAVSRADLWFVGTDESCQPAVERSSDTGTSWVRSPGTAGAYHLSSSNDAALVHAPDGPVTVDCAAVGVAPVNVDIAFIGCEDGTILRTLDRGQTWAPRGRLEGLVSLSFRDAKTAFALASQSRCPSAAMTTEDAGETWKFAECLKGDRPKAIATNANKLVAQVSGDILVSDDDGQTWAPAS